MMISPGADRALASDGANQERYIIQDIEHLDILATEELAERRSSMAASVPPDLKSRYLGEAMSRDDLEALGARFMDETSSYLEWRGYGFSLAAVPAR